MRFLKDICYDARRRTHYDQTKATQQAVQRKRRHLCEGAFEPHTKTVCKKLGIGLSALARWIKQYRDTGGEMSYRGSGNYASDEQKEIARLKRELRDTQDALDVLKKDIGILGND